jgi:glyoxylase-like metal-dependent hydrolase (beta-lactamase superfamily II)
VNIQRTENARWLSNAYLVVDRIGGHGVIVDANQAMEPLLERVEREQITVTHVLLTHHHVDHVEGVAEVARRVGAPVVASSAAARDLEAGLVTEVIRDGALLTSGDLAIRVIEVPGHMEGHLAFLINGTDCLTGDTLFHGSVGGTRAPQATGFSDLRSSVMDRLMRLPPATRIHPGHRTPTTVAHEWETNPFIRLWRGLDREDTTACRVDGREATLVLWTDDYDGGHKAWVRFADGADAIVGGSSVSPTTHTSEPSRH